MKRYRKPYRVRKKKLVFRKGLFWLFFLAIVFAGSVFYIFLFSSLFQVKKVTISGQEKVSEEELSYLVQEGLETELLFFKTKSVFLVDAKSIEENILKNIPQISEIRVERVFPGVIKVSVKERSGIAVWCKGVDCFSMDGEGIIFAPLINDGLRQAGQIKIRDAVFAGKAELGEKVIERDRLGQILEIKTKIDEKVKIVAADFSILSPERLNVSVKEGWEIYFNLKGDLDWQMQELALVLEKQITPVKRRNLEYIDLRFSRVYYKPR